MRSLFDFVLCEIYFCGFHSITAGSMQSIIFDPQPLILNKSHLGTVYRTLLIMPRPRVGALSDYARLTSDVCLFVAYIGPKSRTERTRNTKLAQR